MSSLRYRRDIDGLRAIAILLVIIYHAIPTAVPGGFVGVDIFFVISGYLISSIIFRQLEEGRFSFLVFYCNRFKRIFPALVFMLYCVMSSGWFILFFDEFAMLGKHVAGGIGFIVNILLCNEAGYFDTDSGLKPLMHLWSLGIEEQFYFLFPLATWLLWKLRTKRIVVFFALCLISFFWCVIATYKDPAGAYFLPQTRAWQLLAGCLLATGLFTAEAGQEEAGRAKKIARFFFLIKRKMLPSLGMFKKELMCGTPPMSPLGYSVGEGAILSRSDTDYFENSILLSQKLARNLCSIFGFSLLIISGFFCREEYFPGFQALAPTVGSFLLIYAGSDAFVNKHILSLRPMIWIGLISYPLYLWHWPLFSFIQIIEHKEVGLPLRLSLLALSIVLAAFTYSFVEKPIRFKPTKMKLGALGVLAVLIGGMGLGAATKIIKARNDIKEINSIISAKSDWGFPDGLIKNNSFKGIAVYEIVGDKQTLYVGDSNMQQYSPRVTKVLGVENSMRGAIFLTAGACAPVPGFIKDVPESRCVQMMDSFWDICEDDRVDTVVLGAAWFRYLSLSNEESPYAVDQISLGTLNGKEGFIKNLINFIKEIQEKGKKVIIISNMPFGREIAPENTISRSLWPLAVTINWDAGISLQQFTHKYAFAYESLKAVARTTGCEFVDPLLYMCPEGFCSAFDNGAPIYRDWDHINQHYVREKATFIDELILGK